MSQAIAADTPAGRFVGALVSVTVTFVRFGPVTEIPGKLLSKTVLFSSVAVLFLTVGRALPNAAITSAVSETTCVPPSAPLVLPKSHQMQNIEPLGLEIFVLPEKFV